MYGSRTTPVNWWNWRGIIECLRPFGTAAGSRCRAVRRRAELGRRTCPSTWCTGPSRSLESGQGRGPGCCRLVERDPARSSRPSETTDGDLEEGNKKLHQFFLFQTSDIKCILCMTCGSYIGRMYAPMYEYNNICVLIRICESEFVCRPKCSIISHL